MRVKRIICMVLACIAIVVAISVPANAAEIEVIALENSTGKFIAPFATRSFNISIPAKSIVSRITIHLWNLAMHLLGL